jgi:hypothetical protein
MKSKYVIKIGRGYFGGSVFNPTIKRKASIFSNKNIAEKAAANFNRVLPAHKALIIKI